MSAMSVGNVGPCHCVRYMSTHARSPQSKGLIESACASVVKTTVSSAMLSGGPNMRSKYFNVSAMKYDG